ncbi:MAG: M20/M25/M40 family metallo-hydrolase [Candidatus Sulfotelmatobacter sp.]|jgi:carboxypeptidase Q
MNRQTVSVLGATAVILLMLRPIISNCQSEIPKSPTEDGTLKALAAVAGAGTMENDDYEFLRELSDDIGARVTGSPEAAKAIAWGSEKMRVVGLENVHTESWQLFRGWTRISADAELLSPVHRRLMIDSMGWAGSTPHGGVEAPLVAVNAYQLADEVKRNATSWRDKFLLIVQQGAPPADRLAARAKFGDFLREAYHAGALAVIGGQGGSRAAGMHLTHTGMLGVDVQFDIPVVSMAAEDQSQLERYLERGQSPRLHLEIQNVFTDGPVSSANVVGEIRGGENPEQIVVVGGHLDSWDLASGSTDNGCGVATTLGAAEAIVKSGFRPRRTIRFVLFTGEEQGDDGSFNYVRVHKDEMANHLAAVILDDGQGPVTGFSLGGRNDLIAGVQRFANLLTSFGNLSVDDDTVFDTDTGPFILAGLPGIGLKQDATQYEYTHHSPVDMFDKVQPDILNRDSTIMALTAFWIADRPDRLAAPWPPEKTARMLVERHDDRMLKLFGVWPFGNLGD